MDEKSTVGILEKRPVFRPFSYLLKGEYGATVNLYSGKKLGQLLHENLP